MGWGYPSLDFPSSSGRASPTLRREVTRLSSNDGLAALLGGFPFCRAAALNSYRGQNAPLVHRSRTAAEPASGRVHARLVWHGDLDGHSFLLVSEGELERLERWDGGVAEGGSHAHRLIQPLTSAGTFGKV
jgi:hypothetical protein